MSVKMVYTHIHHTLFYISIQCNGKVNFLNPKYDGRSVQKYKKHIIKVTLPNLVPFRVKTTKNYKTMGGQLSIPKLSLEGGSGMHSQTVTSGHKGASASDIVTTFVFFIGLGFSKPGYVRHCQDFLPREGSLRCCLRSSHYY